MERDAFFVEIFGCDDVTKSIPARTADIIVPFDDPVFPYLPAGRAADRLCRELQDAAFVNEIMGQPISVPKSSLPTPRLNFTPTEEIEVLKSILGFEENHLEKMKQDAVYENRNKAASTSRVLEYRRGVDQLLSKFEREISSLCPPKYRRAGMTDDVRECLDDVRWAMVNFVDDAVRTKVLHE